MKPPLLQNHHRKEVREDIHQGGEFNWANLMMNVLAATIASYGLFANSPAVVIGAMIVAMLLQPIAGIALALLDSDMKFLLKSLSTLTAGIIGVLATALIIGTIHKNIPITNEIMARTAPNLLDLMIALAGGAAGAYAIVSPRLSIAFVGVAIATALVPPLASAGILLARGDLNLSMGALLLAFTNMVAIQFSFSIVLWFSGFRRVTRTSELSFFIFIKRNIVSITILLVLASVLSISLQRVIARQLYESTTQFTLQHEINASAGDYLVEVRFEKVQGTTIVRAVMRGPAPPSAALIASMETKLPSPPDGTIVELRIRFVQTIIINRDGQIFTDAGIGTIELNE